MAIVGITVTERGEVIQRLAVTTKIAIGEVVKTANGGKRPSKLDHFIFLRKSLTENGWTADEELTKHYGKETRDLSIILMSDEVEAVFRTEYAWWGTTEKKCWGNGLVAIRKTVAAPDGAEHGPCGDDCPENESGVCKPSGDLHFILADFPKLGGICRLHTTSYQSIRQLHSALEQIRTITGGRLAGITCKLTVRPDRATYMDKGQKKTTTVYVLNIELTAQGMKKLLSEMTQHAELFKQTRGLLSDGRRVEYVAGEEDETVKARELAEEFPTDEAPETSTVAAPVPVAPRKSATNGNGNGHAAAPAEPPIDVKPVTPPSAPLFPAVISRDQRRKFFDICNEAGWSTKQVADILLEKWAIKNSAEMPADKYDEICAKFAKGSMQDEPPYQPTDDDIPF